MLIIAALLTGLPSCTGKTALQLTMADSFLVCDTIQYHTVRINKAAGYTRCRWLRECFRIRNAIIKLNQGIKV
jgi:hypothetical protein